jgi:tellurite methyltransferase
MEEDALNSFEQAYDLRQPYYGRRINRDLQRILKTGPVANMHALDLGCGDGRYSIYLAGKGFSVTAVDAARTGIDKLRQAAETDRTDVRPILRNLSDFHFESAVYGIVVAATVLDHLDSETRRHVAAGIEKSLAPGGLTYIDVFTRDDPGYKLRTAESGADPNGEAISECENCVEYYFEPGELKTAFPGLRIVKYTETRVFDTSHGRPHHHALAGLIARKDRRVD